MDITISREALLKPLQAVSGVVEKKQTLPILSNVLLKAQKGQLSLTGTDLEIGFVGFAHPESIDVEGSITVSARKLFDICRALPDGVVLRMTLENNNLAVRAAGSFFILNTLPAEDFPQFEQVDYAAELPLKQHQFKELLSKTYFAMAHQDVRHYLNGALLEVQSQFIKCVAADGHRLALATMSFPHHPETLQTKVIIPRKSVVELIRLLSGELPEEMVLKLADNRLEVATSEYIFTSKLIDAQYPDYTRLIPQGKAIATGERDAIKQALTRASILSNDKFRGVRFQFEANQLVITANNADQEQAKEALPLTYQGESVEIGFNVSYLLDVLAAIATKTIRYMFTDSDHGVLIEPAEEGHQSLYVVMPMRL